MSTTVQPANETQSLSAYHTLETIRTLGRLLDDLERVRIMNSNRIGALERDHGEALPHLHVIAEPLAQAEHLAELELIRAWRKHPLAEWAKQQRGVGEKSIARLIAEIGDPYMATKNPTSPIPPTSPESNGQGTNETQVQNAQEPDEAILYTTPNASTPRLISELWAYCGIGAPGRIPRNATQQEVFAHGKPRAKKQLWLIATSMLKAGNRDTYDQRRATTSERIHTKPCAPCHAKPGDPWRDGHKHTDALRITAKHFLKELWLEAQRLHEECATHCGSEAH